MPDDVAFVWAYSTTTGEKTHVPAAWIGHPVLGKGLRKTPSATAAEAKPAKGETKTPQAGDTTKED